MTNSLIIFQALYIPVASCLLPVAGKFPVNTGIIMQIALFPNYYNSINLKFATMTKLLTDDH